ncbi:MAG: glycosyltransferase family 4 protein [Gammaproteobacteria bacterium]|nr:glycosyltransferase family 4 protein [Gammaproteobacteria bacterium]MBU1724503.1 glycosyltransferase family 4 protein [Gammaproteobacteria bacterium]MBU2004546.1 glycosyltransferase family 4 protein [Gammaproteobacteria bacterium]
MSTKKIAIVIADMAAPGGAEKVAADLAEEFHARKHDVTVIKFEEYGDIPRFPYPGKTIHLHLPSRAGGLPRQLITLFKRAWYFRKLFRKEKFDHIFSFLEASNVPCALASRDAVLSMHLDPEKMTQHEWRAVKWFYPRAKRVITVSQQMTDLLVERAHLDNVTCIYNPVNTRLNREKSQEPIALEGRFILAVGRLERQKRFDLLIDAFARTQAQYECKLVIVGRGTQQEALEQQIAALGIQDRVILAGFELNPYKYMVKAEFQVMSSDYEGYPLVLIEALSLGCPIVSTDCPTGPREIIHSGENGLLVEKGNAAALAAGIDQLFQNPELREQMRRKAQESVHANDIATVANAWLAA